VPPPPTYADTTLYNPQHQPPSGFSGSQYPPPGDQYPTNPGFLESIQSRVTNPGSHPWASSSATGPQYPPPDGTRYPGGGAPPGIYPTPDVTVQPANVTNNFDPYAIGRPWNPDYDPAVETKGKREFNQLIRILFFGSLLGLIFSSLFVITPNLYNINMEPGICNFTGIRYEGIKECSCGKNCQSYFQCFLVQGWFHHNGTRTTLNGSFYEGFGKIAEGCTFENCKGDSPEIQNKFDKYVGTYLRLNKSISLNDDFGKDDDDDHSRIPAGGYYDLSNITGVRNCVGHADTFYFEGSNHYTLYVIIGFIPLVIWVVCILMYLKFVTPDEQFWLKHFLGFPYYLVTDSQNACKYARYNRYRW